ncbi:MAG: hypothetical protein LBM07_00975 [Culturomica sp.]|jgi:hypothetical protein|nr:hypothetical protein [Culturomica sp.]
MTTTNFFTVIFAASMLFSCAPTRNMSAAMEDDIYYVPKAKPLVSQSTSNNQNTSNNYGETYNYSRQDYANRQNEPVTTAQLTQEAEAILANNETVNTTIYRNTGYWVGGFKGSNRDLAEAMRIVSMYPQGFGYTSNGTDIAMSIAFDPDWNVYTDNGRFWWFPTSSNIDLYNNFLFGTYPHYLWTVAWNSPAYDSWNFGWSFGLGWRGNGVGIGIGWNNPWYWDPWYNGWYGWHHYPGWHTPGWGYAPDWGHPHPGYKPPFNGGSSSIVRPSVRPTRPGSSISARPGTSLRPSSNATANRSGSNLRPSSTDNNKGTTVRPGTSTRSNSMNNQRGSTTRQGARPNSSNNNYQTPSSTSRPSYNNSRSSSNSNNRSSYQSPSRSSGSSSGSYSRPSSSGSSRGGRR